MFLDVKNEQNKMVVNGIDGINVKKINNMCRHCRYGPRRSAGSIFENEKERGCRVLARAFFKA